MELTVDTLTQVADAARRRADEARNVLEIGEWVGFAQTADRLRRKITVHQGPEDPAASSRLETRQQ